MMLETIGQILRLVTSLHKSVVMKSRELFCIYTLVFRAEFGPVVLFISQLGGLILLEKKSVQCIVLTRDQSMTHSSLLGL